MGSRELFSRPSGQFVIANCPFVFFERDQEVYIMEMRNEWNDLILEDFTEEEVDLLLSMMSKVKAKAMDLVKEVEVED